MESILRLYSVFPCILYFYGEYISWNAFISPLPLASTLLRQPLPPRFSPIDASFIIHLFYLSIRDANKAAHVSSPPRAEGNPTTSFRLSLLYPLHLFLFFSIFLFLSLLRLLFLSPSFLSLLAV